MPTIIVGVEDSPALSTQSPSPGAFARAARSDVVAVCSFPYDDRPEAHFNLAMRPLLQELADETLDRLCEPLDDDPHVRRIAVADLSPARALERVARVNDAAMIVVGSSHAGHLNQLHPGSTAERLLAGSPYPVALAPQGYRTRPRHEFGRLSVAYDGSREAADALAAPRSWPAPSRLRCASSASSPATGLCHPRCSPFPLTST